MLQQDLQHGLVAQDVVGWLSSSIAGMLDHLPHSFGKRFYFDFWMIDALSEEWSQGGIQMSPMIVPKPSKHWAHMSLPLASYGQGTTTHVIDLVLIPGDDRLEEIDLLAYPFLCHELGHNILFKRDMVFPQRFASVLEQVTNGMLRQSLPDKGAARSRARDTVAMVRQLWSPTANHYNWAHEIAMDMIALWTVGPAYLATFQDTLDNEAPNPYQVGQSHPPYEVQTNALIDASVRLGWEDETQGLTERVTNWRRSDWRHERDNRYVAYANPDLVRGCVTAALSTCEILSLPQCSTWTLTAIRDKLSQGETTDFGSELLIAAWLQCQQMDTDDFNAWERRVISELTHAVIPEIR